GVGPTGREWSVGGGVVGQEVQGVGEGEGPGPGGLKSAGHAGGKHVDIGLVDDGIGEAGGRDGGAEVFGESLVIQPVGGPAGFDGFNNIGAGMLAEPAQVVVGVDVAGDAGG